MFSGTFSLYAPATPSIALSAQGGHAVQPGVAVGCVGGVQFVAVADPIDLTAVLDLLHQVEVEVARDSEGMTNPGLVQAPQ